MRVGLPLVSASLICWFRSAVVVQLMKMPDVTCFGSQYGRRSKWHDWIFHGPATAVVNQPV